MKILGKATIELRRYTYLYKESKTINGLLVDFKEEEEKLGNTSNLNSINLKHIKGEDRFLLLLHNSAYLDGYHPTYVDNIIKEKRIKYCYSSHLGDNVNKIILFDIDYKNIKII